MNNVARGTLYVVATPIGNLGDITLRAIEVLKAVDVIAAEDTRHTKPLLSQYGIAAKRLIAVHDHNERDAATGVVQLLEQGMAVALVSDAGTPAISDPGARVIAAAHAAGCTVVPIPGPSALIAAISASGRGVGQREGENGFLFYGFLPAKKGERIRALEKLNDVPFATVFYEAPHRIMESMADMVTVLGENRQIVIARELTKKFETIHRSQLSDALAWLTEDENRQRGEFVLIIEPAVALPANDGAADNELQRTLEILLEELPLKQAVTLTAKLTGAKKNAVYALALTLKHEE